jgi:hypothetical protein
MSLIYTYPSWREGSGEHCEAVALGQQKCPWAAEVSLET